GRNATLALRNDGGVAVGRIVVETEPHATVRLLRDGRLSAPTLAGGRATFATTLAPGEEAALRVELGDGPMRAGRHDVAVRVLARVSLA
ncbi:MAG TPA: hypothetical protein VM582_08655, partial [Candidatus Thermoplasmatota archaeon]|nr:hypothetical protein [Candidatus Thermoplasmatota archaeon]